MSLQKHINVKRENAKNVHHNINELHAFVCFNFVDVLFVCFMKLNKSCMYNVGREKTKILSSLIFETRLPFLTYYTFL